MNALQIREILLKVQKEMKCPLCSASIDSSNIAINNESIADNMCELKMECQNCNSVFGGVAQFTNKVTELGKKLNASSRMKGNAVIDEFSYNDMREIKNSLQNFTSFTEIFAKKSLKDT